MPYDITDAKDDINFINLRLNEVIRILQEKKIIPMPKEDTLK